MYGCIKALVYYLRNLRPLCRSNPLTLDTLNQLVQNAAEAAAAGEDDDSKIENLLAKEFHVSMHNFIDLHSHNDINTVVNTNELSKAGRPSKRLCSQGQIC